MKILQITRDYADNGGIGRYVQDVTAAFRNAGHTVAVIRGQGQDDDTHDVHTILGCDEFEHPDGARVRDAVLGRADAFGPNLVLLHAMDDFALEEKLRARYRVARFVHNHAYCSSGLDHAPSSTQPCDSAQGAACMLGYMTRRCWLVRNPVKAQRLYRRAAAAAGSLRSGQLTFTASRYVRQRVVRQGVNPVQVVVAPYFTQPAPAPDRPARRNEDAKVLLFVGRIVPEKGLHHLLQAMPRMGQDVRLVVNGEGPGRPAAEAQARELGIDRRIDFLGWTGREDLQACYQQADVVVVPSLWPEPFGLVGIEAMSYGVPVVAYGSGAIPEWLTDGVTGHVVARGDVEGLARRTQYLLDDAPLRERMGHAARVRIKEQYTAARHLDVLLYSVSNTQW